MGDMKVTGVNKSNSSLAFDANGKEVFGVKFEGCEETVNALFNCASTDKARELVVFESAEELLSVRDDSYGAPFVMAGIDAAYRYI
jgi:hypothetical protein